MITLLRRQLVDVAKAVSPLVVASAAIQLLLVDAPAATIVQLLAGALLAIVGMALLFIGIDLGILPMGRFIGAALPAKRSLALIVFVAFALGIATTVAEPDVLVLSQQVEAVSGGAIGARRLAIEIDVAPIDPGRDLADPRSCARERTSGKSSRLDILAHRLALNQVGRAPQHYQRNEPPQPTGLPCHPRSSPLPPIRTESGPSQR